MSVDESKPSGLANLVSELDDYSRESREQINDLWKAVQDLAWVAVTSICDVEMSAGQTELVTGVDVSDLLIEVVNLTATAVENLEHITGARAGQIKVIIAGDTNVTVVHNANKIKLNGGANYAFTAGDVLCLVNIGGDPGVPTNGYWKELFRTEWT